jgi:integrase
MSGSTATLQRGPPLPAPGNASRIRPAQPRPPGCSTKSGKRTSKFGLYLWAAFTTGARRGELLALRESRFDFEAQEVTFARNYLVKQGQRIEKDTKTGEGRRVASSRVVYRPAR